jgi:hypothetical protein
MAPEGSSPFWQQLATDTAIIPRTLLWILRKHLKNAEIKIYTYPQTPLIRLYLINQITLH